MSALPALAAALSDRYRLERELGQGGMATVYLAEDLKHHRKVALKVLRPEIAATVGAGRFSREIEVAARLQHPNILTVHDSGEAAGLLYYVMPYVEGESLRERLVREGELPVHDVVRILMEVADALACAHSWGVVHRDIKPDNVLLSGRHALVADFGVAKAVSEAAGQTGGTKTGIAVGTPRYMAPEQAAAGANQDHRVDLYALGMLGYELLTGRSPYQAASEQEMLAAHVTATPDPVERYRPAVSPALAQVIMKCLAKKPADRWQTAEEVLQHLEPLATPSGGTTPTQTRPLIALGNVPRWGKWAAGVVGGSVVGLLAFQLLKPRQLNITVTDMSPVTNDAGIEYQPALSPDGSNVAYVAGPYLSPHLLVRSTGDIGGGGTVRLGDTALGSEWFPSWSPDGQAVRFWGCAPGATPDGAGCAWMESGRLGGASRQASLPPRVRRARDLGTKLAWSPDGARVAFARADTLFTVSVADSGLHLVAVHRGAFPYSISWSPDGRFLAYCVGDPAQRIWAQWVGVSVWSVPAAGGEPQQVASGDHLNASPVWLDARHLLFVSDRDGGRAVYAVEVGPHGSRSAPQIIPGPSDPHSISYSIGSRKLAYARLSVRQNIWSYPLGRAGPISIRDGRPVTTSNQVVETHDLSPDGTWIVYDANLRGRIGLYKAPLGSGQGMPLTSGPIGGQLARWSPDGSELVFCTPWGPTNQVMVMSAQGGAAVALTPLGNYGYPSWSPNGLHIAFQASSSGLPGPYRGWLVSRDSVGAPWHEAVQLTDSSCYVPDWAPDGRTLACVGGPTRLRLVTVPSGRTVNSDLLTANHLRANSVPRFSRDGRTIFSSAIHQDGRQGIWAVSVAGGQARLVVAFDDPAGPPAWIWVSVGRDRLYLTVSEFESDIWVAKLRF